MKADLYDIIIANRDTEAMPITSFLRINMEFLIRFLWIWDKLCQCRSIINASMWQKWLMGINNWIFNIIANGLSGEYGRTPVYDMSIKRSWGHLEDIIQKESMVEGTWPLGIFFMFFMFFEDFVCSRLFGMLFWNLKVFFIINHI